MYQNKTNSARFGQRNNNRRPINKKSRQPKKDYIHPSKFVKKAESIIQTTYEPKNRFEDFNINSMLKSNLSGMGFSNPSPIQDQAIPFALEGNDIIGIASTGTGKTAAFAIPVINKLLSDQNSKALILAPTRELAEQIENQFYILTKGTSLRGVLLIGGKSMHTQIKRLSYRPRVIIGTPGRIKDHLNRKTLDASKCNIIVLDEVDRMLDMGFVNDITTILSQANPIRQSLYFSATLDSRVKTIIEKFSKDPIHITIKSSPTSDNVDQDVVRHNRHDKLEVLHDILIKDKITKTIIFDDTQRTVEKLAKDLADRGFSTDAIHGGKSQSQRQRALRKFKDNEVNVLVATDVAARGLDVTDISHVINYSLPQTYDDYIHRIGRTGRAGSKGFALTFIEN